MKRRCWRQSGVLFGAHDDLGKKNLVLEAVRGPREREEYEQALEQTRAALGEEEFCSAWAEGHALTVEAVVQYAREFLEKTF